ncbi:MAG: class IV adenylate cyclase [Patescibacteria group bacterium]
MKEVEIKAKLRDKEKIIEKLTSLGCTFEPAVTQSDVVYAKNLGSVEVFNANDVFLRLRVKNKTKVLFTIKQRGVNDLDALEHEVEVSPRDEMEKAILLMGYKEAVRVNKTRIITHYNNCEICIDDVENLGTFIEMEKLTEEGDSEVIQEELFKFFESIGISKEDRVFSGYDILMLREVSK